MLWLTLERLIIFRKSLFSQYVEADLNKKGPKTKDFRGALVRRLTAATTGITIAFLFIDMLCYVLRRLESLE